MGKDHVVYAGEIPRKMLGDGLRAIRKDRLRRFHSWNSDFEGGDEAN